MSARTLSAMVFSIATVVLLASVATADQVMIGPTDDSFVDSYYADNNYGEVSYLRILCNEFGRTVQWNQTLIQFDLSSYSGAYVYGAYLRLYVFWIEESDFKFDEWIGRNVSSWDEMSVTWNNKPETDDFYFIGDPDEDDWWVIEVTDWVDGFVSGDHDNYGFTLGTFAYYSIYFYSKESDDPGLHPELELHYYPNDAVQPISVGSIKALFK